MSPEDMTWNDQDDGWSWDTGDLWDPGSDDVWNIDVGDGWDGADGTLSGSDGGMDGWREDWTADAGAASADQPWAM